jgi:hypothetical protein
MRPRQLFLLLRSAASVLCLAVGGGCSSPIDAETLIDQEALTEFRGNLIASSQKANDYLQKTLQGKNVSELTLGWFIYGILSDVEAQDQELYDFFNRDNLDLRRYLETTFHNQPTVEIAAIDVMNNREPSTLRLIARDALEALRHIPDSSEAAAIQERDRHDLAEALRGLKSALDKEASELPSP